MTEPLPETLDTDSIAVRAALEHLCGDAPPTHFRKFRADAVATEADIRSPGGGYRARLYAALQVLLDDGDVLTIAKTRQKTHYIYCLPPVVTQEGGRDVFSIQITQQTCTRFNTVDMEAVTAMVDGDLGRHVGIPSNEVRNYQAKGCRQLAHASEFRLVLQNYLEAGAILTDDPTIIRDGSWMREALVAKAARAARYEEWTAEMLDRMDSQEDEIEVTTGEVEDPVRVEPVETAIMCGACHTNQVDPAQLGTLRCHECYAQLPLGEVGEAVKARLVALGRPAMGRSLGRRLHGMETHLEQVDLQLGDAGIFVEGYNDEPEEEKPERAVREDTRRNNGTVLVGGMTMNAEVVRRRLSSVLSVLPVVENGLDALIEDAMDQDKEIGRALGASYIKVLLDLSSQLDAAKSDLKAIRREFVVDPRNGL